MVIAFLALFPFLKNRRRFWRFPGESRWLRSFNAAGYLLQFLGMETTTAAKAFFW